MQSKMQLIGITGGIGAGKTEVLNYINAHYNARILMADEVANELKKVGMPCYEPVLQILGSEIVDGNGEIDRAKMAATIFQNPQKLRQINEVIHPQVRIFVEQEIQREREAGNAAFFFLEAALLIEAQYDEVVDELWYIYATEQVRRERLKQSRQYTEEKITAIMSRQLTEEVFRQKCRVLIDNSGDFEDTKKQIDQELGVRRCEGRKENRTN